MGTNVRGAVPFNGPMEAALVTFVSREFEVWLVARVPDVGGRVALWLLKVLIPMFDSIEPIRLGFEIGKGGKPGLFGMPSGRKYPLRARRWW